MMQHEDTIVIAATVTLLTQVIKRELPGNGYGPLVVTLLSLLAIGLWIVSGPIFPPDRTQIWTIFTGWAVIWSEAIGLYHGTSIATNAVERLRATRAKRKQAQADDEEAA